MRRTDPQETPPRAIAETVPAGELTAATRAVPATMAEGLAGGSGAAPWSPAAAPLQVRDLSRYQRMVEHGRGGLGCVLRAHDRDLGRTVAIKTLLKRDGESEARFVREAMITARLEHPGIVPVHEAGRSADGTPFYAMKLIAGRPLRELIEDAGTIEQRLALLPHVVAVADAIAYAHSRRILHRDLKPANVMVGEYGETVVIDWGLAKDLDGSDGSDEPRLADGSIDDSGTVVGTVMGTPAYMAPEQARGERVDERADVYALGAMLYAVIAGTSPYVGVPAADLVRAVRAGPPPPVTSTVDGVPADLAAIIASAMAHRRDDRMPSARAFADELRRYLRGQLIESRRYTRVERALRWARRHRELTAAAAVAAILLAIVGAIAVSRVVAERDEADQQRLRAEGERQRAEAALVESQEQRDALVLNHARVALDRDPASALAWLRQYRGRDAEKMQEVAAIALARHAPVFSRNRSGADIVGATAVSFDPPHVLTYSADSTLHAWRADQAEAAVVASDVDAGWLFPSPSTGEVLIVQGDRVLRLDPRSGATSAVTSALAPLRILKLTPDGGGVVTASADGPAYLHRRDASILDLAMPAVVDGVHNLVVSRGGAVVVVCGRSGGLWRRDPRGRWHDIGRCSLDHAELIAVSADGRWLASAVGASLEIHAVGSTRRVHRQLGQPIGLVRFAADGHLIVGDHAGGVYDIDRAGRVVELARGASRTVYLAEAADGAIAIGHLDGDVRVISRPEGDVQRVRGMPTSIRGLQFSPDGRRLLIAERREVRIVARQSNRAWRTDATASLHLAYSPDGRWLAAGTGEGELLRIDPSGPSGSSGAERGVARGHGHDGGVSALAFTGDRLVSAGSDRAVRAWSASAWTPTTTLAPGRIAAMVVDTPRERAFTIDDGRAVVEHDLVAGRAVQRFRSSHEPRDLAISPAGDQLVILGFDGHVELVDTATYRGRHLVTHAGGGGDVAFAPDGSFCVTTRRDGVIDIRASHGDLRDAPRHGARCEAVAVSPANLIASVCDGNALVVLRRSENGWEGSRRQLEAELTRVAFSADSRFVAAADIGGRIYIVDVATGALAVRELGETRLTDIAFSPDGRQLAAAGHTPHVYAFAIDELDTIPAERRAIAAWLGDRLDELP